MEKQFDYSYLFDQALSRINSIRSPHSGHPEYKDLHWDIVQNQALFEFGGDDFEKMVNVYEQAKKISISCLQFIIQEQLKKYGYEMEVIHFSKEGKFLQNACFIFKDCKTKELLVFKVIEDSAGWKVKGGEPPAVAEVMKANGCSSCVYIYLMFDYAYLQIVGHNDDETDPGRGYNLYSLKWFFEKYFGAEEYSRFFESVNTYINAVNANIGYSATKMLVPGALNNFRRIVERAAVNYDYTGLIEAEYNQRRISETDFNKIKEQFLMDRTILTLVGTRDFSESLITAEWLLDSMKKAKAIDLTVIGMGYFKAIEQLLFDLICLHKNCGLLIWKNHSRKDLPENVELNDDNIESKAIEATLGSMAAFAKNAINVVFRNDLTMNARKFVVEAIYNYSKLRNGFFHKDNIKQIQRIEEIREQTLYMCFLLLGSFELSERSTNILGYPQDIYSDYYRLCEYVNYHAGNIFVLDFDGEEEQYGSAFPDLYLKTDGEALVAYSGVYFKELRQGGSIFKFSENNLPKTIYLAKFEFERTELIKAKPVKDKKIFENNKYVGPSIATEMTTDY